MSERTKAIIKCIVLLLIVGAIHYNSVNKTVESVETTGKILHYTPEHYTQVRYVRYISSRCSIETENGYIFWVYGPAADLAVKYSEDLVVVGEHTKFGIAGEVFDPLLLKTTDNLIIEDLTDIGRFDTDIQSWDMEGNSLNNTQ